jgi:hypothetical protein
MLHEALKNARLWIISKLCNGNKLNLASPCPPPAPSHASLTPFVIVKRAFFARRSNLALTCSFPIEKLALMIGFIMAFCSLAGWIIFTAAYKRELTPERMVLLALISVSLTPFVLPKMHERYFYPADALSLIVAFFNPDLWIIPFAFQLSSGLAYSVYLKGKSPEPVMYGAIINTVILIILIVYQFSRQIKPVNTALEQGVVEQEN